MGKPLFVFPELSKTIADMNLPVSRTTDIVIQPLEKEIMVYDLIIHQAYCLNDTAARIYQACDGKTSFEELRRQYHFTDDIIHLGLDELNKRDLLETKYRSIFEGMTRREVIKKVGLATAVVLPLITALAAPRAANALSTVACPNGQCICSVSNIIGPDRFCSFHLGGTHNCVNGCDCVVFAGGNGGSCQSSVR